MYAALWRLLPGPVWLKIIELLVVLAAVLAALFFWVYPWVSTIIGVEDSTVTG